MKAILSSLIFLLALASFSAGAQAGKPPLKRTLWIVKDSGFVVFSPYDLMYDESLIRKNFTHIVYVKPTSENVSLITKKHSMKPHMRIESNIGRLSFIGRRLSSDHVPMFDPDSVSLANSQGYGTPFVPNQLCVDGSGRTIAGGVVSGIDKKTRSLKVTIYDNFSDKVLGERVFELSPTAAHYYTTELHYMDTNGNPQIYTDGTRTWIPANTTISAKVVVKDEDGTMIAVKAFQVWFPSAVNNGAPFTRTIGGDKLPWNMPWNINLNTRGNETYVITPKIEDPLDRCGYVKPLVLER